MYKIYLDTSDRYKNIVKLLEGENVVGELSGDLDIVTSIATLLKENKVELSQISEFNMNPGPGSFTGLRIGASIVNALNYALGLKKLGEEVRPKYEPSKFD